ncbi:fimbrial biogenesis chaperone [Avibacterium paragallinarum]|uniref:Chaperone protein HifB n=1 Tax=Avibacterium paragallinarum TaxID=728 RepID=A0AAE5WH94_AVIPA|nr:fimbria/pilus periplasmic chaperone [Avibacterium paragallinarum]MEE3608878.1 fimbria/pilus periplasmic chaperone [Avibacterium paragallinarum]MEE3622052.1 fimbria/pilus periplasmic chaperone [Avibacterium paragallinarum]MEE3669880.1 fimbria/pilus periplasmic chaperone [Avibacterium paragallinarum]MEE3680703.1 fimbria/pilus periplasmic chaperone [Avibacterium paragallinarum]MEE4386059.1 fimbria/pilus periplasmic chaperone [Avibacterium paragallinarum]
MNKRLIWCIVIGVIYFMANISRASIIITGTRVIYPSNQRNVNVQLTNTGDYPSLVQSWIDAGNSRETPDEVRTPFVITPPITRIEKEKGQTLRITYTGEPLAKDRETVFYLNILDIPPKPIFAENEENRNHLQIAVRSRIKLFFRPSDLNMDAKAAYDKVEWQLVQNQGKKQLLARNPTPYFITFHQIEIGQNKKRVAVKNPAMIPPFSDYYFELNANSTANTVYWVVINDYGGKQKGESKLVQR